MPDHSNQYCKLDANGLSSCPPCKPCKPSILRKTSVQVLFGAFILLILVWMLANAYYSWQKQEREKQAWQDYLQSPVLANATTNHPQYKTPY